MGNGLAATHVWTLAVVGLRAAHARLALLGLLRHKRRCYRAERPAPPGLANRLPVVVTRSRGGSVFLAIDTLIREALRLSSLTHFDALATLVGRDGAQPATRARWGAR